ncbi:hypothetical protein [Mucilaginibacter sp. SG564]|uniref:hypothetical protein n=1 Tax=unclassified Mucilaginibacter TaxID=2617802 RepID=UPI001558165A|nr:hypothetical protein [Mucilaginibacter sp. SG564]NOW96337.1 hypothetical protein [Mucilaginibacter sp. SG564]
MDIFSHIKSAIGIILGLSITHLLRGAAKQIQHPGRSKPYWVHSLWSFYLFILLLHFWWWEYNLHDIKHWLFAEYLFVIIYIVVYYSVCALLYPDDLNDYKDYEDYFYSRRKWIFGILGFSYLLDIIDTLIKGNTYLHHYGIEYPIRNVTHFVLCMVAIKVNNRAFHAVLVIVFIVYEFSYILRLF